MGKPSDIEITNRLRVLRAERKLTQEQLADAVGVTRVTINYIENGEYRPSLELALKLAVFFATKVEDIFKIESGGKRK